ncbi:MAG: DMT family transporter [Paracoccaceae bacterium]|nr:DMT family transporter [Paracoccaceae bacterium]
MEKKSSDRSFLIAHMSAAIASLIAGFSVILTSLAMNTMQPSEATFVRYFFAFVCVVPFCVAYRSKILSIPRSDFLAISALGILFYFIFPMTFNKGLQLTTASLGALIMSLMPTLALLFGAFFKVEKLNIYKALGCFLAIAGVAIGVSSGLPTTVTSNGMITGNFFMFLAIVQGALFSVFSRRYFQKYGAWLVSVISIAIGFLVPSLFVGLSGINSVMSLSGLEFLYLLILGTVGVPVQFGLFAWSLSRLGPSRATMYIVLTPLSATVLAVAILNETITSIFIVGLFVVMSAIFLANRKDE